MTSIDTRVIEHSVTHEAGSLHVLDYPGEEPAIVLMHGFPDDHRVYDKLLPLLSPRRAVAFDWLGYGRSDRRMRTRSVQPVAGSAADDSLRGIRDRVERVAHRPADVG